MAHGTPDWAEVAPKTTVYGGIDLAELAARLGSVNTYDRRGDLVWFEDFESGIGAWQRITGGVGAEVVWEGNHSRYGGFCCKLTAGSGAAGRAEIDRFFTLLYPSKIGFEVSFTINYDIEEMLFEIILYDGTYYHKMGIRYHPNWGNLYLWNSEGVYEEFWNGWRLLGGVDRWKTLKFVVDIGTGKYVRCMFERYNFDISAHAYEQSLNSLTPYMVAIIRNNSTDAAPQTVYTDCIIFTQNEP